MDKPRVLFVDDEDLSHATTKLTISSAYGEDLNFVPEYHLSPQMALNSIKKNPFNVAAVFMDEQVGKINGEKISGSSFIPEIRNVNSYIKIIMVSGDRSEETLTKWLKIGADNYIYKAADAENPKLAVFINDAVTKFNLKFGEFLGSHRSNMFHVPEPLKRIGVISTSPKMSAIADQVLKVAGTSLEVSVLILGESGTGKELIARALHDQSPRKNKPYRIIDCTQFRDSDIIGSELFGSEAGAFTGAVSKVGLLESANGGTVFIDELHHLGPKAQGMLLRFLEDRHVRKIGGKSETKVDVRLIFAAQPQLANLIKEGKFLPDLAFRLRDFDIVLPRLQDRDNDVEVLAFHFLDQLGQKDTAIGKEKRFHPDSIELLKSHSWPGNVRDLKAAIKRAWLRSEDALILPSDFDLGDANASADAFTLGAVTIPQVRANSNAIMTELILKTYKGCGFNVAETARVLDIPRSTLRELSAALGIAHLMDSEAKANFRVDRAGFADRFERYMKMIFATQKQKARQIQ